LHCGPNDERQLEQRIDLARQTGLPLVAANDVHFHHPSRRALADVLTATRHGCTVAEASELLFPNAARHLKSPQEMRALFARAPEAIARTVEIADRYTFSLDELRYEYPRELAPPGMTPRLSVEQRAQLPALVACGALAYGCTGDVWTATRVAVGHCAAIRH
jgi:error-prone DNA polymerase